MIGNSAGNCGNMNKHGHRPADAGFAQLWRGSTDASWWFTLQRHSLTRVIPITYSIQSRNGCNSLKIQAPGFKTANYLKMFCFVSLIELQPFTSMSNWNSAIKSILCQSVNLMTKWLPLASYEYSFRSAATHLSTYIYKHCSLSFSLF